MITAKKCQCGYISVVEINPCPICNQSGKWTKSMRISSLGSVISWTVLYSPPAGFNDEIPLIIIELEKGLKVLTTQKNKFPIRIGQKVFLEKIDEKFYITPIRGGMK